MNEDKATRYRRLRRRTAVLTVGVWVTVAFVILVTGASRALADSAATVASRLADHEGLVRSLSVALYVLAVTVGGVMVTLPLTWYREFGLERRFGRLRRPAGSWLWGQVQTTAVHLIVATVAVVAAYEALFRWPEWWWIAVGGAFGVLMLVVTHLAPLITFPRLYRVRPIARPELRDRLQRFVQREGVPVAAIHEWQLGSETPRPNAALVGVGSTRQVLLTDSLLADYSDDEIEIVLAHELAHHVHGDVWRMLAFETVAATLACGAAHWALLRGSSLVGLTATADVAGLPVAGLAGGVVVLALMPVANGMSRRHERRADAYALATTKRPEAMVSGLRRLAQQSLAEARPPRLVEWLFYTHPPLETRLGAARRAIADDAKGD